MKESEKSQPEKIMKGEHTQNRVYKLVLTGGPCGGKTTGQAKVAGFFESLGWKVFRVPETATVLMSGGIAFGELNQEQVMDFQENLLRTMMALESTYFSMAEKFLDRCNVLVICDRGAMDASAYVEQDQWRHLVDRLGVDEQAICEDRYDHVVHMVSAANGAEEFYSLEDHCARFEGLELARERDERALSAWRFHPYLDIVDNRSDFDSKLRRLVDLVVRRVGRVDVHFEPDSRKVKFALKPDNGLLLRDFPVEHSDFEVVHHYLKTGSRGIQTRLRKRGHGGGRWTYSCTVRKPERSGQTIEVKTSLSRKDYETLLHHADTRHLPVYKTRRCFLYGNQHFQLDIYRPPCHERCRGLMLLETFTTHPSSEVLAAIPDFLPVAREVTGDPAFSMYNLALRSDWREKVDHFCHRLDDENECDEEVAAAQADSDEDSGSCGAGSPRRRRQKEDDVHSAHRRLMVATSDGCGGGTSDYYSSGSEM